MSIRFERNGKKVELNEFLPTDVYFYLKEKLYGDISFLTTPWISDVILASYKKVPFIINAEATCIELSFMVNGVKKMQEVIDNIKKWDAFSNTEEKFYVLLKRGNSMSVIFENGYASQKSYLNKFKDDVEEIIVF